VKAGIAAGIAVAAMAFAPAASAKNGSIYDFATAKGFERVTFTGDADAACAQYGVCGYAGTVTYTIGGKPHGKLFVTRSHSGNVKGRASYKTTGVTRARVTPPPGQGADCTDTISHKTDVFSLGSAGSQGRSLLLNYHAFGVDYLDTTCAGPNESAVADAGFLPLGIFKASDFFRGARPQLTMSGSQAFRAGGFSSVIDWNLSFKVKARACSPNCRLPAGTP
jgi:hypothetical protein